MTISETAKRHAAAMAITFDQRDAQVAAVRDQAIKDCINVVRERQAYHVEESERLTRPQLASHAERHRVCGRVCGDIVDTLESLLGDARSPEGK